MLPTCLLLLVLIFLRYLRIWFWMLFRPGDKHHRLDGGLLVVIQRDRVINDSGRGVADQCPLCVNADICLIIRSPRRRGQGK